MNFCETNHPTATPEDGFVPVRRSLADLVGEPYVQAVCAARAALSGEPVEDLLAMAREQVDFLPAERQARAAGLLGRVGSALTPPLAGSATGAASLAFHAATRTEAAPVSAWDCFRVGEDGRLYLATKSEHYHAPLGHDFPGYALLERARRLGIPNATHNNTRGHVTRLLEEELVRAAGGLERGDAGALAEVLGRTDDLRVLNRVLNLETGSLAVEAGLKMMLARFHHAQPDLPPPPHAGRVPVLLVMGNDDGGLQANYHGTTVLAQMLRGMWPDLRARMEAAGVWKVVAIRPNRREDLDRAFAAHGAGGEMIAGFLHEIVMMNYGGRRLERGFLEHAYALCAAHGVPTLVDEIQSCMWAPGFFLFREYGLRPSLVAVGKGFPGGEYPASRILFSAALDSLPQFGALVTNGQEELASLAYLVTMEWARANAAVTAAAGERYEAGLRGLAVRFPGVLAGADGRAHLGALRFRDLAGAKAFAARLNGRGLDISAQAYKQDCPPVVLTKLPLVAGRTAIDAVLAALREALAAVAEGRP